ncbi:MAG: alpha/beta hydrolase [Bradyrhizobium sp.]
MTLFLNFRSQGVGGAVVDPYVLDGNGTASPPALRSLSSVEFAARTTGKNVLFAVHGFNVSYDYGARSLGQLEPQLNLTASDIFLGVLWPGDYWLPVINYPFEGGVAMDCGRRLADFCGRWLTRAQSISFVSHSLGARVVLEAVKYLGRRARVVCLTAAAINRDCLETEYSAAAANADSVSILASHEDWVLKIAFQAGDPIADALHDDHTLFEKALGYDGPALPAQPPVQSSWQIPNAAGYGHGDYLPPGDIVQVPVPPAARWPQSAGFMARAFHRQQQTWP